MKGSHDDYWKALERLKMRKPFNKKITKDAVAQEAGRKAGSIKKSRPGFTELILAIDEAEAARSPGVSSAEKLMKARATAQLYRDRCRQSLNRELMQELRISELEKHIEKLEEALSKFDNVVPLFEVT